ncbi:unnamed protein product [Caenorhabditis nigoni]|uniref:BTB domain-containing protein n=1 Tax=Caenorhabditis nigoni TaxID=1611254 RepID=A0A2G5VBV6_9PELO|nr:hypothetical protein B9Z55_007894 [Caenorhabditis nigoni]
MTDIVKLNVGGTIFQTAKSTLTKFDGFFRTMFETPIPVPRDESGAIFIDRSPKHFDLILNFMRDGHVGLQKYSEDVEEILKEAEYYLLGGLMELCNNYQKPVELEYPDKFRYIRSDEELFDVTFVPNKPVLVFFGPIFGGSVRYPECVNLLEFQKKYASKVEFYIRLFVYSDNFQVWYYKGYANGSIYFDFSSYYGDVMTANDLEESMQRMLLNQ